MIHSYDVNVIFSYNFEERTSEKVNKYITEKCGQKLLLLPAVRNTFVKKITERLELLSSFIQAARNRAYKTVKKARRKENGPVSDRTAISFFKNEVNNLIKDSNLTPVEVRNYLNLIFSDDEILRSLKSLDKLNVDFRLKISRLPGELLYNLEKKFNVIDYPWILPGEKVPAQEDIYKLRANNTDIFSDKNGNEDKEDILVAIDYLTFIKRRHSNIQFAGCDKNMIYSLNFMRDKLNLKTPEAIFILKKYNS